MKLLNNYSNNKPHNPHGFKEEVKIKFDFVKAIHGKFPNGTAAMTTLLAGVSPPLDWGGYWRLTPDKQLVWEERGDELNKSMIYLKNSNDKHAKKDLRLAYSQGNLTDYPPSIEGMVKYLSTQYPNNKPTHQRNGKKGG